MRLAVFHVASVRAQTRVSVSKMAASASLIARKRPALKTRITSLTKAIAEGKIERSNALVRLERLTESFKEYESLNDELIAVDAENIELTHAQAIEDSYYEIATKVRSMLVAGGSNRAGNVGDASFGWPVGNSTLIEKQRFVKLPIANLPRFSGDHNQWLSFKNTFLSMIDARNDVDDVNKFLYLRGCLDEPALNKLALYDVGAESYKRAWDTLVEEYEKVRILVAKHYDGLIDIPTLSNATFGGLTKIVDDARQHLCMLESLKVKPEEGLVVRILERKLPIDVRTKWEETLNFDAFPGLTQFYKFVSETAFRLNMIPDTSNVGVDGTIKRKADHNPGRSKVRKTGPYARSFVTSTLGACGYCSENHPIYRCTAFEKLSIQERWSVVKTKQLCKNCLRLHIGNCTSSHCKRCNQFHNTLLHSNATRKFNPGLRSSAAQAEQANVVPARTKPSL